VGYFQFEPVGGHVSASFVKRQNWTVGGIVRRYPRLSKGFSRKIENHAAATGLNYFAYNFVKIHRKLRTSPCFARPRLPLQAACGG
jgi:hypothetical protein